YAHRSLLLTHAGVSIEDLDAAGVPIADQRDTEAIEHLLNAGFDSAITRWAANGMETPFAWKGLHLPGNDRREGRGIFYHRPSNPQQEKKADLFEGPPFRRFDARRLPIGIAQAVGHTADRKCREMLGGWVDNVPATPGILRHLRTDGREAIRYTHGTPDDADA